MVEEDGEVRGDRVCLEGDFGMIEFDMNWRKQVGRVQSWMSWELECLQWISEEAGRNMEEGIDVDD